MCACACVCICVCGVCVRACVTSCFELPVNVVECYTWRVLVYHQFKEKKSHDIHGLETTAVPLGRQLGNAICKSNVAVTLIIRSNSIALDRCVFTAAME